MTRLRYTARKLKERALSSLFLSIELFNRPYDNGRVEAVLILLHHSFEMLLKAKIWQERGSISERRSPISYKFDKCLGIALSDLSLLDVNEALTLSIIDGLRDCAVHNLLTLSEENLYLQVQAGVTLFADVLERGFQEHLARYLPNRVLPISTNPPDDIELFLNNEFQEIRALLSPGRRRRADVYARLRPFLIMDSTINGEPRQPVDSELKQATGRLLDGEDWRAVFRGVGTLRLDTQGSGISFNIRFTRDETAMPTRLLRANEEAETPVLVREVNLLDRYSLSLTQLAAHVGLSTNKTLALMRCVNLQENEEWYREFALGSSRFKRYSQAALIHLRQILPTIDMDEVWSSYRPRRLAVNHETVLINEKMTAK